MMENKNYPWPTSNSLKKELEKYKKKKKLEYFLSPAKTYILRGTRPVQFKPGL